MPLYDFTCEDCGVTEEIYYSYGDYDPTPTCKICGRKMRRVYSTAPNVNWNFPGSTRYRDSRVELGLQYEEQEFGRRLTDEEALRINESRGL